MTVPGSSSEGESGPLPVGYRQGIITAVTVVLGFSLVFARFWTFELPGTWDRLSLVAEGMLGLSIVGQTVTLWRSLRLEDDDRRVYRRTLRWFVASTSLLLLSLALSGVSWTPTVRH